MQNGRGVQMGLAIDGAGAMIDKTLSSEDELFDVVQIGYGPVGQANALMLGQLGYEVAVFERHPNLFGNSRVGHIDHEIMRILQSLGTASSMEEQSVCPEMYEWRTADGRTLYKFPWLDGISGWRAAYLFYQPDLETALDSAVRARANIQVSQGWEATEIEQYPDHVAVTLRERGAGSGIANRRIVRAKYLLATDGGNSFVRQALDLQMRDLGYKHGWLVLDFLNKRKVKMDFDNGQICDPRRPTSLFEMGKRHRRFSFAAMPGETEQSLLEPEKAWELVKDWITPDDAELTRQVFYVFEARVLDQMRHERIFFLGDSAHVMPPFLGQGMGSGIRDAKNLAWKLDLVLRGLSSDTLLDTYSPERQPHSERYAEISMELARVLCTIDPEEARRRDEAILSGIMPPLKPFPWIFNGILQGGAPPAVQAVVGRLGPQGAIRLGRQNGRADDVVGSGWQIISRRDLLPVCSPESRQLLESLSFRFIHFGPGGAEDTAGVYTKYFKDKELEAIVVRPDFYLFGGIREGEDINGVLRQLRQQLHLR
jgi:2-polyprenyl-6-methoxyphenol hydroxylase-like FAD-dependent oxidoreductase